MEYKPTKQVEHPKKKGLSVPFLSWVKRKKISVVTMLLFLLCAIVGWYISPQDFRSNLVSTMRGYMGLQVAEIEFQAQSIDDIIICKNGMWEKYYSPVAIPQPDLYQDSEQYDEGDIVTYDILSSVGISSSMHKNCNVGTPPGGMCEQYYCMPNGGPITTPTPLPSQPNQPIGLNFSMCDLGASIGSSCKGQNNQGVYEGECGGICQVQYEQSNGQKIIACNRAPYDDICEGSTQSENICVGRTVPCNPGGADQYCGDRYHEKRFYEDEDISEVTPGLCRSDALLVPDSLNFMRPEGWTWRCVKGDVVSPTRQDISECYARVSYCGDETIDTQHGETCDDGVDNGPNGACSNECVNNMSECGNGILELYEECDNAEDNGPDSECSNSCKSNGGANMCLIEKIGIKAKASFFDKNNSTYGIEWVYDDGMTNGTKSHRIYNIDKLETCDQLKVKVAEAYCGELYDSQYFDASGLLYRQEKCIENNDNEPDGYVNIEMEGTIQCCNDSECNDYQDDPTMDPEMGGSCPYGRIYTNNGSDLELNPQCNAGREICSDNNYMCMPENSGVEEVCDRKDNDCDGTTDEGGVCDVLCYEDEDGDGYGDQNNFMPRVGDVCPTGYVEVADNIFDCNDNPSNNGAQEFPGNPDVCADGIDQDCSGLDSTISCDDESDYYYCYKDGDKDGYGNNSIRKQETGTECSDGFVRDNSDCDDTNENLKKLISCSVFDADNEVCNDGFFCIEDTNACPDNPSEEYNEGDACDDGADNDCDGVVDDKDDGCDEEIMACAGDIPDYASSCEGDGYYTSKDGTAARSFVSICSDNLCEYTCDEGYVYEDGMCIEDCLDINDNGVCDDDESHNSGGRRTGGVNACGDGRISISEECDDGNSRNGDGCSSACEIENVYDDEEEYDDPGNTKNIFADYLSDALRTLEDACDYDDYNYQDIMFRDVEWDPDSEAINTLLAYCIVKGYDRSRNTKFYADAATSKAEAIKILAKLDGMGYGIPFDEDGFVRGTLPFRDMKPNAWYTTYVMYAHAEGLLEGIGENRILGSELKALTPIKKSEMRTLLRNAGIDTDYRELDGFGQYVYRDDMANIMVDAFGDKLKDYQYLYGNNIRIYSMLLQRLQDMSAAEQLSYIKRLVSKFKTLDHWVMGENFNLHMRGMVEFLENILYEVEK